VPENVQKTDGVSRRAAIGEVPEEIGDGELPVRVHKAAQSCRSDDTLWVSVSASRRKRKYFELNKRHSNTVILCGKTPSI